MESPSKRQKMAASSVEAQDDFVPLGGENDQSTPGYANDELDQYQPFRASRGPRADADRRQNYAHNRGGYDPRNDPRHARDRPKSKHALPGYEPWILIRTKFKRRFVHNLTTKESLWRIPKDVMPGVVEFEKLEKDQQEKTENARWAEEQLKEMRDKSRAEQVNKAADEEGRSRRRRSESLQRDDEEALMAELAAQAESEEENDVKETVRAVQPLQPQGADLESDSEYEVVEVTDSEGEEGDEEDKPSANAEDQATREDSQDQALAEENQVEFGEDDIAYQLAAMGEDYGLDPGEYGEEYGEEWEEGAEGLPFSEEDAANLFRDLLDDYRTSPFTPWDKIIADESETSILNDQRYTILPNMRARKDVFDAWARDKAAKIKEERAAMDKRDPKIPYLAFLQEKATPKLYWPEFKRKYKREAELNDRKLSDKDREKLYRDHINRLKLPESTRTADLQTLLKSIPLRALSRDTTLNSLPQPLLSHLHFISLAPSVRDIIVESHLNSLPSAPEDDGMSAERREEEERKREDRRRREKAMAERERQVDEERKQAEKDEYRARSHLREEERELQRAMNASNRGIQAHLQYP